MGLNPQFQKYCPNAKGLLSINALVFRDCSINALSQFERKHTSRTLKYNLIFCSTHSVDNTVLEWFFSLINRKSIFFFHKYFSLKLTWKWFLKMFLYFHAKRHHFAGLLLNSKIQIKCFPFYTKELIVILIFLFQLTGY